MKMARNINSKFKCLGQQKVRRSASDRSCRRWWLESIQALNSFLRLLVTCCCAKTFLFSETWHLAWLRR